MKIGFIGLGIMGRPMALNLKNAGHDLIVPERSSLTDEIRAAAKVVATPKAVAAECRGADPDGARHPRRRGGAVRRGRRGRGAAARARW